MATSSTSSNDKSTPAEAKDVAELKAQMDVLKADLSALTSTLKEMGVSRAEALRTAATDQAASWRSQGEAAVEQVRAKGREQYGNAEQSIRENPAMAVGIAAGIGFLTGLIFGRK